MKLYFVSLFILVCLVSSETASALDLSEKFFPKQIKKASEVLVLNGAGFRRMTIFKIRIYALGLYLNKRSNDASVIVNSNTTKLLKLKFNHSVSKLRLYAALLESIQDNYSDWQNLHEELEQLKQNIPDVSAGDEIIFLLEKETVKVSHNGVNEIVIASTKLQQALLLIWLGPEPAGKDLKAAILGL